jgi:hypothetical protein
MPLTYSPNRQDPGASLLRHAKAVMVMSYLDPGEAHRVEVVKRMEGIVAAKQIAEFEKQKKNGVPTVFPTRKSHQFFRIRKTGISLSRSTKRRRSDSNRCIKVLQTSPLPLGYGAINLTDVIITKPGREVSVNGFPGSERPFVFECRGKSSDVYSRR